MVCIYCSGSTSVINSRHQKKANQVWRRRACTACNAVFTTLEAPDTSLSIRIRRNGTLEAFSREKLLLSLYDSLRHRKTSVEDATGLTGTVMTSLYPLVDQAVLERDTVVEVVNSVLNRFDKVAATHYAAFHPL